MQKRTKKFGHRYPWDDWFAKNEFILIRDRDFPGIALHGMAAMVRNAASARGISVTVTIAERLQRIKVVIRSREGAQCQS